MAIDYPNSPTVGQVFTSGSGSWTWDGTKWTATPGGWTDAPTDGKLYERQSQAWALDPIQADAPDTNNYVRQQGLWVPEVSTFGGGFLNKLRNGTFDVWQRGAAGFVAPTGTIYPDGWYVTWTGAGPTLFQYGAQIGRALNACGINGVALNTDVVLTQRIESSVAAPLSMVGATQNVTFQALIKSVAGAGLTPKFSAFRPTGLDTGWTGGMIDVNGVSLQACLSGATTRVAYTFSMPAGASANGYAIGLDFGPLVAGQNIAIGEIDLRATPGLAVGLQANPPPPELRPISEEMIFCQRYFESSYDGFTAPGTASTNPAYYFFLGGLASSTYQGGVNIDFKVKKRITPTVTAYSNVTGASGMIRNVAGGTDIVATVNASNYGVLIYGTGVVGTGLNLTCNWTASAEL
jgi:hypothetical protein